MEVPSLTWEFLCGRHSQKKKKEKWRRNTFKYNVLFRYVKKGPLGRAHKEQLTVGAVRGKIRRMRNGWEETFPLSFLQFFEYYIM